MSVQFEWDEAKRVSNLAKHGLDFRRVDVLFDVEHVVIEARTVMSEERWKLVAAVDETYVTVVYTWRGETARVISIRSARHEERRRHQAVHGR